MVLKSEINKEVIKREKPYPAFIIAAGALTLALIGAKYAEVTNPQSKEGVYCDSINIFQADKTNNTFRLTTAFHTIGEAKFQGVIYSVKGEEGSEHVYNPEMPTFVEWEHQTSTERPTIEATVVYELDGRTRYNMCTETLDLK